MKHRRIHASLLASTALVVLASPLAAGPLAPPVPSTLPQGPQTQGGSAQYNYSNTGPSLTVNQTSQNLITNWTTFNIGSSGAVQFVQPNSSAIALNRVTGDANPSQIFGSLTANGILFLVNPNGILFGQGAQVNVGGLLATTHDIKNSDFMAGRYNFNISGNPTASIVNEGTITAAQGGFAALVAPGVRNSGIIEATLGTVGLAAGNGFTLDMYGDKLITLAVGDGIAGQVKDVATGQALSSLVSNTDAGKLSANGGKVQITAAAAKTVIDSVINNTGVIEANAIADKGGTITLSAATAKSKPSGAPAQNVKIAGTISAAGKNAGQKGGTIKITGENIALKGAKFDASGQAGGGTVLIGGSGATAGTALPTATTVTADKSTTIDVSATQIGDGGKVVVWSDQLTSFAGLIKATGGALGGNGGFVETSGGILNVAGGRVDTSAPFGRTGLWLLDPFDLTIDAEAAATIASNLSETNVTVETTATGHSGPGTPVTGSGDIDLASSIWWSSGNTFTLSAYRNINVNPGVIIGNTGSGNLTLRADNTGTGTGGVFFNGFSSANFSHSTGTVSIYYNVNSIIGMQTNPNVANQLLLHMPGQAAAAYVTNTQDPWNISPSNPGSPDSAMNTAFGVGNWTKFYGYNPAPLNGLYKFVYVDGGGATSANFNGFVSSNESSLQNFVQTGGALFLNAARWTAGANPNSFESGSLNLGFGATLSFNASYSLASFSGQAVNPNNAIFHGPFGDTGISWTGNYFSHDVVSGPGLQPLITGTNGTVLASEKFGAGFVMLGGITSPFFHSPQPQADNLLANILFFTASQSAISVQPPPNPPSPIIVAPPPYIPISPVAFLTPSTNVTPPLFTPINLGVPSSVSTGNPRSSNSSGDVTGSIPTLPGIPPLPPPPVIRRGIGIPPAGETRFKANEVVLELGADVSPQRLQEVAARLGLTIIVSERFASLGSAVYRFRFPDGRNITQIIRALEANGIIAGAQPSYVFQVAQDPASQVAPADPSLQSVPLDPKLHSPPPVGDPAQYVIPKLQLDNVHEFAQGNDVLVALIDSEIDRRHPDLQDAIVERYDAGCGAERPDSHGTGMAGAIGSRTLLRGVAPRTRILAICAFGGNVVSAESTTTQIIRGIDYAVTRGARIINMSFAGPHDPMLERALRTAHDKGIILIAAAGNAGPKSPPLYPGADPAVIAVTATDIADRVFAGANRGKYIMVAAPGVDVMVPAPDNHYTLTTGTSVAAANVSGVAALLMESKPNIDPETLRYLLVTTARALGARTREEVGSGLVDPVRALAATPPQSVQPDVTSSVSQPRAPASRASPRISR